MIPLSLYIHIPWCVQKCPYCDFNSHQIKLDIPETEYVQHLLLDLAIDLQRFHKGIGNRKLQSIFIGGGTPSLFAGENIHTLLKKINAHIEFSHNLEITLEANPCTLEKNKLAEFIEAGVNRLSIGVQSFSEDKLRRLGRAHNLAQAQEAIEQASKYLGRGLNSFNLDLMHGLPQQTLAEALSDLQCAIDSGAPHISWYQLTIEPNTVFAHRPPILPSDELLWEIFQQGDEILRQAGYQQYETSAYAKENHQCQHNLNYWRFGDYLAIGCGAFGKISTWNAERKQVEQVVRFSKTKHPRGYMRGDYLFEENLVSAEELAFEFFMNRFRLGEVTPKQEFYQRTGLDLSSISTPLNQAIAKGYLIAEPEFWQVTDHGKLFLNDLLQLFLP